MPSRYEMLADRPPDPMPGIEAPTLSLRRWILAGVLSAVVVLGAIGIGVAWHEYGVDRSRAAGELKARAVLAETVFDAYFSGRIAALRAIAAAPVVRAGRGGAIQPYLARVQAGKAPLFTGALAWVDRSGVVRASTTPTVGQSVADRSYFRRVLATGRPFVSEGLIARRSHRPTIAVAVPTYAASGALDGLLVGGLPLAPAKPSKQSLDLGYAGLEVLDRLGRQLVRPGFRRPANSTLAARVVRGGPAVLVDTTGLDGARGRVVAYARSGVSGWTVVLDQPASTVFGAARRGFLLEAGASGLALLLVLAAVVAAIVLLRSQAARERVRMHAWTDFARSLGTASIGGEVAEALGDALAAIFPDALVAVLLRTDDDGPLALHVLRGGGPYAATISTEDILRAAELGHGAGHPVELVGSDRIHERLRGWGLPDAPVHSVYSEPMLGLVQDAVGAVVLLFPDERTLDWRTRALLDAHLAHSARILTRTRHYEGEHEIALALQRSFLPSRLPTIDGVRFAGRYRAGGAGVEIGGDWYDVVHRGDGLVHVIVGDVAGRGVDAAQLMGELRHVFRAYAQEYVGPDEILARLVRHVDDEQMATAVCLTLDPLAGELAYASAGHLPSLVLDEATGAVRSLDDAAAAPLGYVEPAAIRAGRIGLGGAATVVAYTDGLVERRGQDISERIAALARFVGSARGLGVDAIADEILAEGAAVPGAEDDTALLVVAFAGAPSRISIAVPALPTTMARLRRRLDAWLVHRGVADDDRIDIAIAVSEACNNAILHGYGGSGGTMRLTFEHAGDRVRVTVEDEGAWQAASPVPGGGYGITIMDKLMDESRIDPSERGTRVTLERQVAVAGPGSRS